MKRERRAEWREAQLAGLRDDRGVTSARADCSRSCLRFMCRQCRRQPVRPFLDAGPCRQQVLPDFGRLRHRGLFGAALCQGSTDLDRPLPGARHAGRSRRATRPLRHAAQGSPIGQRPCAVAAIRILLNDRGHCQLCRRAGKNCSSRRLRRADRFFLGNLESMRLAGIAGVVTAESARKSNSPGLRMGKHPQKTRKGA